MLDLEGTDSRLLKAVAECLLPDHFPRLCWSLPDGRSVWDLPLSSGIAFEWTVFLAIASEAFGRGYQLVFPSLQEPVLAPLFVLRNEIPRAHGAQPGHAASRQHRHDLHLRFLQSLVPKLTVTSPTGKPFSIFREGCPYHAIMSGASYEDRPDITVLPGCPSRGFPTLTQHDRTVEFGFEFASGLAISGSLSVIDSQSIPCVSRTPSSGARIPVAGIVECSVKKGVGHARKQLEEYRKLFSSGELVPACYLVTGNRVGAFPFPHRSVDLAHLDASALESEFRFAGRDILSTFGLT